MINQSINKEKATYVAFSLFQVVIKKCQFLIKDLHCTWDGPIRYPSFARVVWLPTMATVMDKCKTGDNTC